MAPWYGCVGVRPYGHMTCTTIGIFNHKGGVGKTTTAVNLGASLAHAYRKKVLVVDMDPQANTTRALLGREPADNAPSVRTLLAAEPGVQVRLNDAILSTPLDTLHLIPADIRLSEAELKLTNRPHREFLLRNVLQGAHGYDYILIDCPPSLGILSLNALTAADAVIVPCETQFLSLRGIHSVLDVLSLVRNKLNPGLRVLGILPTKFYVLSLSNREVLQFLIDQQATVPVFQPICRDVRAEEAPNHGLPLVLYAPESRAAQQYLALAGEVIRRCHA